MLDARYNRQSRISESWLVVGFFQIFSSDLDGGPSLKCNALLALGSAVSLVLSTQSDREAQHFPVMHFLTYKRKRGSRNGVIPLLEAFTSEVAVVDDDCAAEL